MVLERGGKLVVRAVGETWASDNNYYSTVIFPWSQVSLQPRKWWNIFFGVPGSPTMAGSTGENLQKINDG
jgi:hypothetical protein